MTLIIAKSLIFLFQTYPDPNPYHKKRARQLWQTRFVYKN